MEGEKAPDAEMCHTDKMLGNGAAEGGGDHTKSAFCLGGRGGWRVMEECVSLVSCSKKDLLRHIHGNEQ